MDDEAIAQAIATVLTSVTPPADELPIQWAGHELQDGGPSYFPAIEILPPDESIEWLPGRQMRSTTDWTVALTFASGADLPSRMRSLYRWRTAIRTQLATSIQLGLAHIEGAYLVGMNPAENEIGQMLLDVLELQVRVIWRGPVSTISA